MTSYAVQIQEAVEATCSHCSYFESGLCRLKAEADWESQSYVDANDSACPFFDPADPDLVQIFAEFDALVASRPYLSESDDADNIWDDDDEFDYDEDYEYAE